MGRLSLLGGVALPLAGLQSAVAGEYVVPADEPAATEALIASMRRVDAKFGTEARLCWLPDESLALNYRPGNPDMTLIDPVARTVRSVSGKDPKTPPEFVSETEGRFVFYSGNAWRVVDPKSLAGTEADKALVGKIESRWDVHRNGRPADGNRGATLMVRNNTSGKIFLFWKNGAEKGTAYGTIEPGATTLRSTYEGHSWELRDEQEKVLDSFRIPADGGIAILPRPKDAVEPARSGRDSEGRRRSKKTEVISPEAAPVANASGLKTRIRGDAVEVTGAAAASYTLTAKLADGERLTDAFPSTDGHRLLAVARTHPPVRQLTYTEAHPKGSSSPRVFTIDYPKAGDAIDQIRPVLFDAETKKEIPVDPTLFADVWTEDPVAFEALGWSPDGAEFLFHLHYRTHQLTRFVAVARDGSVRTVLEERSATFIDYSQKGWFHVLRDSWQLLWASERDGRNHLYRFDLKTGVLINRITSGDLIVRSVDRVDEKTGTLDVTALAVRPGEDPYYKNLLSCRIDGKSAPVVLTEGDGDHSWEFSPGRHYLIDRWSRVDAPPALTLRDAATGAVVQQFVAPGANKVPEGYPLPERFTAKGRDGKTDIYGVIYRPSRLKAGERVPVVEHIYAGPHGFVVPKRWGLNEGVRRRVEQGYAVVIIDGMGTNWRDRAFHDVCYRNIKDGGFPDRIAWMKAAAAKYPELDISRVGIIGGSAGGQNAVGAAIFHGDFYKAAVGDCGCHDQRIDKMWWNEAWMGWPVGPEYADNSNITHAAELRGKVLLLVGEIDTNVDPASTYELAEAFKKAGKPYDFLMVPGGGHCVASDPVAAKMVAAFFEKNLRKP